MSSVFPETWEREKDYCWLSPHLAPNFTVSRNKQQALPKEVSQEGLFLSFPVIPRAWRKGSWGSIMEKGVSSNSSPNYFSDSFSFFCFCTVVYCINASWLFFIDFFGLYFIFGIDTEDMMSVIWNSPCSKGVFLKHSYVMGRFLPSPLRNIDLFQ